VKTCNLVLFDLDGTLFDHDRAAGIGVAAWLQSIGVEPAEELIDRWFEAEARYISAWHRGELDWQEQRRARLREMHEIIDHPAGDARSLDQSFDVYLAAYQSAWRTYPDVDTALEEVQKAGLQVAVLTNGAAHQQQQKIAAVGLQGRVGPVFSSDAIGFAKPDARAYGHVCDQLNQPPGSVLHVGDRYELDVVAARAAGLNAVYLDRDDRGPATECHRIRTLLDLQRFL
jgi:putative hydrolase of the HAD superfamily